MSGIPRRAGSLGAVEERLIDLLRADLDAAEYRTDAVEALLGQAADTARARGVFAPARRVLAERDPSPLATLVRVFLIGERVDAATLGEALPALGAAGAIELGLVSEDAAQDPATGPEGGLRAALSLNPVRIADACAGREVEWRVISDLDDQLRRGPARPDHVMGVGGATRSLIAQAPPGIAQAPPGETARCLDLGTGCGIVAMHLALRGPVVATDISERALALARANARLNGVEGIEFRRGDLFAPVAGERFELILSNPPFVITPREEGAPVYEYRDGGLAGDELAARVIREASAHLVPGGTLLCLANWETPWGGNGLERVRGWVAEAAEAGEAGPLSGWVIERDRVSPEQYAETWARDGGARPGDPAFEAMLEAWLRDFAERRVVAIGLGSVRVRREPDGAAETLVHAEQAMGAFVDGALVGSLIDRAFACGIAAERMSDAEVLAERWVRDAAVVEERTHRPGEEDPTGIALVTDRPIARRVAADTLLAAAIGACDGELALGQIADALATILEVDADAASEALVAGVRELAWLGMLRR
ncbi:methyltransferase [Leucobacter ruminantium]